MSMKKLSEYIAEELKKVGEYRNGIVPDRDNSDRISIVDRNFSAGLDIDKMTKLIKEDVDTCFKLKKDVLNADYDKAIELLVQSELKNKFNTRKESEVRDSVIKNHPEHDIDSVVLCVNPMSQFNSCVSVVKKDKHLRSDIKWDSSAMDAITYQLKNFVYQGKYGNDIELYKSITGWVIEYSAFVDTKCPKTGVAYLRLKLDKDAEKLVDDYQKRIGNSIGRYYSSKKPGEYTGD